MSEHANSVEFHVFPRGDENRTGDLPIPEAFVHDSPPESRAFTFRVGIEDLTSLIAILDREGSLTLRTPSGEDEVYLMCLGSAKE